MIAKLRVARMVAGCAPGMRTIVRSILFHWTTMLIACVAVSASFRSPSVGEAACAMLGSTEKLAHMSRNPIRRFCTYLSLRSYLREVDLARDDVCRQGRLTFVWTG